MKFKVLALTFSLMFFASISVSSFAQVVESTNSITVVDNDQDKNKKKSKTTESKKETKDLKSCKDKKKCCSSKAMLKDDTCKDKKSDKDKR